MDFKKKPWEQKLPLHPSQRQQWESFPVGFSGGGITKGYAAEEIKNADPSTLPILSLNPAKPGDLLPGVYSMSIFQGKRFHQNLWAEEELNLPCIKYSSITDENGKAPFPTVQEISCVLIKGRKMYPPSSHRIIKAALAYHLFNNILRVSDGVEEMDFEHRKPRAKGPTPHSAPAKRSLRYQSK
ncbi:hypothetical protein DKX38_011294 [Salix brachista]|uniref:Uncharacterized protein n=1 Tax=Salix brachista TaxID=2182728 RepID=A0A5N5LZ13_9ROSI|nr:hypothetical protein DKX38_011294 [Salix brachista]